MKKVLLFSFLFFVYFVGVCSALEATWYGNYLRTTGKPKIELSHFSGMPGEAKLIVKNGDGGLCNSVTSAKIILNGELIFGPQNFQKKLYKLEKTVLLKENNWISIELISKPGSCISIEVIQEVDSDLSSGYAKLPTTTKLIGRDNTTFLISVSSDGLTFIFDKNIENNLPLNVGNILAFGITNLTPSGALRKIISINYSGNEVIINTIQASLAEAIENCNISLAFQITQPDPLIVKSKTLYTESSAKASFSFPLDSVVYDQDGNDSTTYDQVRISGDIDFTYEVELEMVIDWFHLEALTFTNIVSDNADINVDIGGALSFDKEKEITKIDLPSFMVWFIVFDPELGINVGVNGQVYASMTTGIVQKSDLTAGLKYDKGSWEKISNFDNKFDYQDPDISTEANIQAYAGPQLELLIMGFTGPYTQVRGYLEFDADLYKVPCWDLYAGLAVDVGVKVECIDWTIADKDWPGVIDWKTEVPLAEGNCGQPSCTDADGDGYYVQSGCGASVDCNDNNKNINPGKSEICDDGIDNDCDGKTDCSDTACVNDSACQTFPNGGLVSYYSLDEISGNVIDNYGANTGVNYGAMQGVAGKIGNAYDFENDELDYVTTPLIPADTFAISFWAKLESYDGGQTFGTIKNASGGKDGYAAGISLTGLGCAYYKSNVLTANLSYSQSFNTDQWYHLVYTVDEDLNLSVFVDGEFKNSTTLSSVPDSHDMGLMIGNGIESQDFLRWDGLIDEVGIWNRALTPEEIANLYNNGAGLSY